jgi:hypothetical protein
LHESAFDAPARLRPGSTGASFAPEGWEVIPRLQKTYLGSRKKILGKISALVKEQQAMLVEEGYSPRQAHDISAARWAEVYPVRPEDESLYPAARRARETPMTDLHLSAEGIRNLEQSGRLVRKDRLAPEGSMTAVMLADDYAGGHSHIDAVLKKFVRNRINELAAMGAPRRFVEETSHRTLGDVFKSRKSGHMAFHITPYGLKILERSGKLVLKENRAPLVPDDGWKSGSMIEEEGRHVGITRSFNAAIASFIIEKQEELVTSGMGAQAAQKTVFERWAGLYRNAQGRQALFISPEGVAALEAEGKLLPIEKRPPRAPRGWQSIPMLQEQYAGRESTLKLKIETFLKEKRVQSSPAEVYSVWGGIYTNSKGHEGLFISPDAVAELVERNLLKPHLHVKRAGDSHAARELRRRATANSRKRE